MHPVVTVLFARHTAAAAAAVAVAVAVAVAFFTRCLSRPVVTLFYFIFGKVEAPILFVAAEKDELCPADIVRKAVSEAQDASLSIHDNTHFEIYLGDVLEVCFACILSWRLLLVKMV